MYCPRLNLFCLAVVALLLRTSAAPAPIEPGFVSLFDGQSLKGWTFVGKSGGGYRARDGVLVCEPGTEGNLFTEKQYSDFVLRFEFMLPTPGANNGIAIRSPLNERASSEGMEIQVLEESGAEKKYGPLQPEQFHGSVYDCIAAKRGALKPPGEWNTEEIMAQGRQIKVTVNGQVILDADLNSVTNLEKIAKHPGLFRPSGHIGFLGHQDQVEFRRIRIWESAAVAKPAEVPAGFVTLFNGRDLTGWQGTLLDPNNNPYKRAALTADQRAAAQAKADEQAKRDWKVEGGELVYRGQGYDNLGTARDYKNFEMVCEWKIEPKGDSGIYLRGTPQVQIWEPQTDGNPKHEGSGGLYNNQKSATGPLKLADRPIGEWNQFRIILAGDKVHVFLNGELVVNGLALENYWDRAQPLLPLGPVELQAHKNPVRFRNLAIREIP
ncbi:MAG TPA: DUF1080 domain-containing protein [Verrucomicrobiota bacterium]|nr:DUF1080 domain-containing protein [Verrucomicrobiota bacterium]